LLAWPPLVPKIMLLGSNHSESLPSHVRIPDEPEPSDPIDYALLGYRIFSTYITLSLFALFVWSLFAILVGTEGVTALEFLLHLYNPVLCVVALLMEMEHTDTIRDTEILHRWSVRGTFYAFIGLQTHAQVRYQAPPSRLLSKLHRV
jgi:hypothetical protein